MKTKTLMRRAIIWVVVALMSLNISLVPSVQASPALQEPDPPPATPLPDPLENPLPGPDPFPVSAWRPPLYPTPWALKPWDHFFFNRPTAANKVGWPLAAYRYGGTNFAPDFPHTGIDIVTDEGTPVLAAGPGIVEWTGWGLFSGGYNPNDPYGISIMIKHDFGYNDQPLYTIYAHLSESYVALRQRVETGDLIAASGDTGNSTAPHIHFEIRNGYPADYYSSYNPELWSVPPQGWGVLAGRMTTTWNVNLELQTYLLVRYNSDQFWFGATYGTDVIINSDPYYNENFVLSDLPAGWYQITIPYAGRDFKESIYIHPGAVTYVRFQGLKGIYVTNPFTAIPENLPIYVPPEE